MPDDTQTLIDAARAGDLQEVERRLTRDPENVHARAANGDSPLLLAIYAGAWPVIELLLSRGATHDVFTAAATGNTVALAPLLGADGSRIRAFAHDGWTPLHLASFFGHVGTARLLIERGADLAARSRNATDNLPLHAAAVQGHADVVALLLASGADPNARAEGGYTPLNLAAAGGHGVVVESLLAHGADLEARDAQGRSAAEHAAARGHLELASRLSAR
jgi:ankyrin repeat protein